MKIYTDVNKFYNRLNVGIVLLGDHNQIYLEDAIQICEEEEYKGHVIGIERAISFVKNMKPLYAKKDAECIFNSNESNWVQTKINSNIYLNRFKETTGISIDIKKPSDEDNYYLMIARNKSKFKYENNYINFQRE